MNPKLKNRIVNDLYIFYRVFVASMFRENVHAPHIQTLSNALMNIAYNPNAKKRLCVAMPPQHSKSSIVTLAYTVWLICRDPSLKILVINAEASLSETFGIRIRQLMQVVGPLFGVHVSDIKSSNTHIMFEKKGVLQQGEIRLTGADGSITGHPVDVCIIDDPYKGNDLTPTLLKKKVKWFKLIVEQRLKEDSLLIIVHTRWHSEDLQGYLWENDRESYDWVMFQAIDEKDNILWPQFYSRDFYENKLRRQGNRLFQSLYQQKPLDLTSDFFYMDHLHWDDTYIDQYNIANCRSYDMAYTDEKEAMEGNKDADYTGGLHAEKINENHYIFSDFLYKRLGKKNIQVVQRNAKFDGLNKPILIETGTKGGAAKELFRLWDKDYLTEYNCIQSEPIGTKADRATALANAIFDGKIHIYCPDPGMRKILKNQLESFPNGKAHKDLIDAMAHAYNYLKDKHGSQVKTSRKRQRRRYS